MSKIHGAQNGHTVVTIFDHAYPCETQAEGQAVNWAVATGACEWFAKRNCWRVSRERGKS